MMRLSLILLAGSLVPPVAQAQDTREFPLTGTSRTEVGELVLSPDHGAIDSLQGLRHVALSGFPTPGGEQLVLELERIDLGRLRFGFRVDGLARPRLLDGLGLSVWRGGVRGDAGSNAMLAFGHYGSNGWVEAGGERFHLVARPDGNGDYFLGDVLVTTDALLARRGLVAELGCSLEALPQMQGEERPPAPTVPNLYVGSGGPCALKECTVAMETDYQLFQVFGSLNAMTTYVTTLLTFISNRYETQVGTILTFPYLQFYTNSNDPWSSQDGGGGSVDLLYEFRSAWLGNVPANARLAHFMSGANLGGGVAWLDVLCNDQYNFAVSGNINGNVSFPVQQAPTNWDFMVIAHELGHNFASPHTHDYCPPLDQCAPSGYFGQCQNQQVCTSSGTIMSYCHLCAGGTDNITTFFHPSAAAVMTSAAQSCLPDYGGAITAAAPQVVPPGTPTAISATVVGSPQSGVQLRHRISPADPWSTTQMSDQGGGVWSADLPSVGCSDALQFYVEYVDADCGPLSDPADAPAVAFEPQIGVPVQIFHDDFEQDLGWFPTNLGATSGDWERGVPVNDPSWAYGPASDYDGSGQCYLTENAPGNTDVDNGAVRLTSPSLDLSGGVSLLRYAYFLRLTNQNGADRLLVEASHNGLAGPWHTVALHTQDGGLAWRLHTITGAELAAAGLVPSADTRFRFTANDDNPQSIVEAGLDAFEIVSISCQDPGPTAYCTPGGGNSLSAGGAELSHVSGSPGSLMTLELDQVPIQPGIFVVGNAQTDTPFGCGRLCISGQTVRSNVYIPPATSFQAQLDTTGIGLVPFNLQYWYRDPSWVPVCGEGFNLSNALSF